MALREVQSRFMENPFGEIVNSTGMASWFGFTGEQQDGSSGLTYLRARYYDPALGRFLTPDSLIPDITNGQALNAYAYVYNDPVNLIDPSGNIPDVGNAVVNIAKHLPASWQSSIKGGAAAGLGGLDSWYGQPDSCGCSADPYDSIVNHPLGSPSIAGQPYPITPGVIANAGYQLWWAFKSIPASQIATKTVERFSVSLTRVSHKVPQFIFDRLWPFAPSSITRPGLSWGWHVTGQSSGSYNFIPSGRYRTGLFVRATIDREFSIRPGVTGFVGSIAGAGLIDGLWQTLIDLGNKCLSLNQRFWRSFTALGLGIIAGVFGTAVFAGMVALTFPGVIAAGAGFAVSAGVGYFLNRTIKEPGFAANPGRYGY